MVAYSFKKQFAELIIAGTKRQTIRADRKRHARPGEKVQLYTGMRTKQCRLIGTATCMAIDPITLRFRESRVETPQIFWATTHELDHFARSDGFYSWTDLIQFWITEHHQGETFTGYLIRWSGFQARTANG